MKKPRCAHCQGESVKLRANVTSSGVRQVAWRCLSCERWAEKPVHWIGYAALTVYLRQFKASLDDIPIVHDYSSATPCVICGEPGEMHHWAPRAYQARFGDDWVLWPMAPLCQRHHHLWHTIVTPDLLFDGSVEG